MSDSPVRTLARTIRDRRVIPWTLAYLMGAWVLLEATSFLVGEFDGPEWIVPVLTVILAFGTFSAITFAWYHGAAGWQRITRREGLIHAGILATLLGAFWAGPSLRPLTPEAAPSLPITRVGVLHFNDHSEGGVLTPLSRDLTEAVVHRLAQVPALDVVPLSASEPFRDGTAQLDSVIAALGAGSLVDGSLTILDDEIVVTAKLIDADARLSRASWVFSRPRDRRGSLLAEVGDSIAGAVRAAIGRQARDRRIEEGASVPGALAMYRRARAIIEEEAGPVWREDRERGVALLDEADRLLREAERLDPAWAEPVLLRIDAADKRSQLMGGAGTVEPAVVADAIDLATRALRTSADSARILERRGFLRFVLAEHSDAEAAMPLYAEAESDFRAASRMDGARPRSWWGLSQVMERRGSFEGAYEYARKAYETDSFLELTHEILDQLTGTALNLERLDEATHWCDTALRLLPGDQTFAHWQLMILASLADPGPTEVAGAWAYVDTLVATAMPDRRASWRAVGEILVAATLAGAGQPDSARAVIARARRALDRSDSPAMQAAGAYYEARARLRLGQYDAVFPALARYTREYGARAESLADDWWFRDLWGDPRFIALYGGTPTEAALGSD